MQPYDYSLKIQSPFEALAGGVRLGATIADVRKQQETENMLRFGGQLMSTFAAGAPQVGIDMLKERATAERNAGREEEAKAYETYSQLIELNPGAAQNILTYAMSSVPGGDKLLRAAQTIQTGGEDQGFRAAMQGAETVEDVFSRIPKLAQLGTKGVEFAKALLTQQRLGEKQKLEGQARKDKVTEKKAEANEALGLMRVAFGQGAFDLEPDPEVEDEFTIRPTEEGEALMKTGALQFDEKKASVLGIDSQTMAAIQSMASTDPKGAARIMAEAIKLRVRRQNQPQKLSADAQRLVEAGYTPGSSEFRRQMIEIIKADVKGKERGGGVNVIMDKASGTEAGKLFDTWMESATSGNETLRNLDEYEKAISGAITGPGATVRLGAARIANLLGFAGDDAINSTRTLMQGLSELTLSARGMLKGQGAITEGETELLRQARSGKIDFTAGELKSLFGAIRGVTKAKTERDTSLLKRAADKGSDVARLYLDEVESRAYQPPSAKQPPPGATPAAPAAPAAPQGAGPAPGRFSVRTPTGEVFNFPSQEAADAFRARAGIK